ncbi:exonuclease SbcCD subunit D [Clostridium sediminicola]|uniref:metallophosphoesterase family protein n=1 Tax=Clostridium sediminicola TaxID=3114879 RepID=UPI0031F20F7F
MNEKKLSFIHTADIHLGRIPHVGLEISNNINKLINNAVFTAFEKIVQYAIENNVDFIIIAGDLYDSGFRTVQSRKIFYEGSLRLKENNIDIYLIRGNHDAFGGEKNLFDLPSNVYEFTSDAAQGISVIKNDICVANVIGQSYRGKSERRKLQQNYSNFKHDAFNIGILHTGLEANKSNYVPCSLSELKEVENIHYWALGHIHKKQVIMEEKPTVIYPGTPQGTDINEEGVCGCCLVKVDYDNNIEYEFLDTASIVWKKVNIDLTKYNLKNINELQELLMNKGEEIITNSGIKGYAIRWIIEGQTELNSVLREDEENTLNYLMETLNAYFLDKTPFLISDSIILKTIDRIDELSKNIQNNEILKELEIIFQRLYNEENFKEDLLNNLGNIFEKNVDPENINEMKFLLQDEFIQDIIGEAKNLIYQQLLKEGDFIEDK